jgi:serpin B
MHRRHLLALSGSLLAGAVAGCSAPSPPDTSEPTTDGPPAVDPTALETLVADTNAFSMTLYDRLVRAEPEANAVVSPLSVSTALAMAEAGARGETREQMRSALRYSLGEDRLHAAFEALLAALSEREAAIDPDTLPEEYAEDDDPVPFQLSLVNAVWGQASYPFRAAYLDLLDAHYGGGFRDVNYVADPEAARETINAWVDEQTAGRIEELLPRDALDEYTRLVLTNAVFFAANWQHPFPVEDTGPAPFHPLDGEPVAVSTMSRENRAPYVEIEGVQALDLPYVGNEVSMLLVLPPAGEFRAVEEGFSADRLDRIVDALEKRRGRIALPRFEFGGEFALKQPLTAMGMPVAFDRKRADFSGMADLAATGERLFVDDVYHDTFVAVDETGTEAAAATGVVVGTETGGPDPFAFVADRPFLFFVRDRPTGTVLFAGRVVDAAAAQ